MAARVLVVDDSLVTAKVTQSYLEAAGYVVQTVGDGQAALEVFKALGYEKELLLTVNCTFSKPGLSRAQIEKALSQPINSVIPYYEGIWTQAINVGAPALLGPADNALLTVYEDLAWQVSGPLLRQSKPAPGQAPSATWQRVTARWRGKEATKK